MLHRLSITNYLLIDGLELDLGKGFTSITGETGSGKSIVIGALGLALGDRAEGGVARDGNKRCVIEVEADAEGQGDWFTANEVPWEQRVVLRRQIEPGGRSRAFVNDTPVRLEQLRELGERLVHIHSQHQSLLVNDPVFQLELIDSVAGLGREAARHATLHAGWRRMEKDLAAVREEEARSRTELDYITFQLSELDGAALIEGEQADLERKLQRAENAESLVKVLLATEEGLSGDDGAIGALAAIKTQVARIGPMDTEAEKLATRLDSVRLELADVASEAGRLAANISVDPGEATRMRERLDLLLRLQHKHRANDTHALIALRDELRQRSQRIGSLADRIRELELHEGAARVAAMDLAARLSRDRRKAMIPLQEKVQAQLHDLGMPHARFHFMHEVVAPSATGVDSVRAGFSANKDRAPEPLDKAASGGELSRVVLAMIAFMAESRALPTVVFDEIDTGVSGEVAQRVGALLANMSKDRQVIAITHLPQIASKARHHLLVSKDHEAEVVTTSIRPVNGEERVLALAEMLSGKKTGKAAMENARELLRSR